MRVFLKIIIYEFLFFFTLFVVGDNELSLLSKRIAIVRDQVFIWTWFYKH